MSSETSRRNIVRKVKRMTRQSGFASLIGKPQAFTKKTPKHRHSRKALARHFKQMRFAYDPKSYERYRRGK